MRSRKISHGDRFDYLADLIVATVDDDAACLPARVRRWVPRTRKISVVYVCRAATRPLHWTITDLCFNFAFYTSSSLRRNTTLLLATPACRMSKNL